MDISKSFFDPKLQPIFYLLIVLFYIMKHDVFFQDIAASHIFYVNNFLSLSLYIYKYIIALFYNVLDSFSTLTVAIFLY